MRFVIQRVDHAAVRVNQNVIGEIGLGFMVLIGIHETDNKIIADTMLKKLLNLRIFQDENGKTNLDLQAVKGSLLLISQFTLYADCRKGNRPSFVHAGNPDMAKELYEYIIDSCRNQGFEVETGEFGAEMEVSLLNHGPFTVILDSNDLNVP